MHNKHENKDKIAGTILTNKEQPQGQKEKNSNPTKEDMG